ncbi:hypothetical protein OUZ56_012425 [Daphnia magna]|uniref:Uncharacterized protein n=1 Tax=Daphnia magna TaxID=35525 RepID=A0ABQ9Z375_9CRUS|nr:hypothetical protein OUZ56_012425 [Daphnia magna]
MSSSSDPSASTASSSSSESGEARRPRHRYRDRSRSLDQSRSAGEEHHRSRYRSSDRSSGRSHSEDIHLDGSQPWNSQLPTEVDNVAALPPTKVFFLDRARSKKLRGWMSSLLKSTEAKKLRGPKTGPFHESSIEGAQGRRGFEGGDEGEEIGEPSVQAVGRGHAASLLRDYASSGEYFEADRSSFPGPSFGAQPLQPEGVRVAFWPILSEADGEGGFGRPEVEELEPSGHQDCFGSPF